MAFGQSVYSGNTPWAAFQRGIKQDEKVTVQVLQRKLDVPMVIGGSVSSSIAETFGGVHYQIVVKDAKGKVLENYGWSGENNGAVFSEPNERISGDYGSEPAFEATVSYDEFRQTLSEWKSDAKNRKYSFTNAGVGGGLTQPGYNGETRNDESRKMTMMILEENCQRMAYDFATKLAENGSCSVTREFSYPRAIVAANIASAVVKSVMTTAKEENGNDVIRPKIAFTPSSKVQSQQVENQRRQAAEQLQAKPVQAIQALENSGTIKWSDAITDYHRGGK